MVDTICDHDKGVSLVHSPLAVNEATRPPVFRITSLSQRQYKLKVNCSPLEQSNWIAQNMSIQFSSLKAFHVPMRRKPQYPSCECCCHVKCNTLILPSILSSVLSQSWYFLYASFNKEISSASNNLGIRCHQISPTMTRLLSGLLSNSINHPDMSA